MQVRAIVEAACEAQQAGGDPKVEIMIPLVATASELQQMRDELEPVANEIHARESVQLEHLEWGTMIELPRARGDGRRRSREAADFFSFGTNDLTQTAFGFSRDDIGKFVGLYEERKLVPANPFVTIDVAGRRAADADRIRRGTRGQRRRCTSGSAGARRRSGERRVLPRARARLRELFPVPRGDGPPGGRPSRRRGVRVGVRVTEHVSRGVTGVTEPRVARA